MSIFNTSINVILGLFLPFFPFLELNQLICQIINKQMSKNRLNYLNRQNSHARNFHPTLTTYTCVATACRTHEILRITK